MWTVWTQLTQIMPGAGLLERAKSLQLKKPSPRSSDLGESDMFGSQVTDARSFKNQDRYRHIQEQFTGSNSRPVPPRPDLAKRDVSVHTGHDRHKHGQSDRSSIMSSSTVGHNEIPEKLIIGLALGSPRENPLPPIPPDGAREDVSTVCSSLDSPIAVRDHNSTDLALQKGRRWRTFTGLFSKKDASSHFYLLGQNSPRRDLPYQYKSYKKKAPEQFVPQQEAQSTHPDRESKHSPRLPQERDRQLPLMPRRSIFRRGEAGLRRRIGWRNTKLKNEHRRDGRNSAVNRSRSWPLHILRGKVQPSPQNGITASSPKFKHESLLQVEIPSVHMERFSVMFSNLLEPDQPESILARRQGTLAEIKLTADDRNKTEPIRVTRAESDETEHFPVQISKCAQDVALPKSGQLTVSSSPSSMTSHPTERVPLEGSNLDCCHAAATSSLPIKPKMKTSKSHERNRVLYLDRSPVEPLGEEATSNGPGSTLDFNRCHQSIVGRYPELPDCEEFIEKDEDLSPLFLKPGIRRPSPPQHHEGTRSMCTHSEAKPKEKTTGDLPEISIARQISVSKRQRQLLVPIVSKQARQPKQPKFVIESEHDATSRKSHYLTVEHA